MKEILIVVVGMGREGKGLIEWNGGNGSKEWKGNGSIEQSHTFVIRFLFPSTDILNLSLVFIDPPFPNSSLSFNTIMIDCRVHL